MRAAALSPLRVVRSGLCIGCGSCVAQSDPTQAHMVFDRYGQLRPFGPDTWWRSASARLARTCPFSPAAPNEDQIAETLYGNAELHPAVGRYLSAYVGYAATNGFREQGSSGGMVSWVLAELLGRNLIDGVAHVVGCDDPSTENRFFRYRISRSLDDIRRGAKSRYYPIEASEVLREIRQVPGRYAVVGVPCFIKAVQLLRLEDPVFEERIAYTLGLFCGHMKSARFAESFAEQMGLALAEVQSIDFRAKDPARPATTYTVQFVMRDGTVHKRDWWNLAEGDWGSGFFQYEACNFCDDVIGETADISFGDAWVEPYSSDGRGTNVVVVRTEDLDHIVREGIGDRRLELQGVEEDFIIATQAAGFRQRREGLAYRLLWRHRGLKPQKRVSPDLPHSARRRVIYRSRAAISSWSHRVFNLAQRLKAPRLYFWWARRAVAFYHGFAYSRGAVGRILDRLRIR
jgi:coenzyme F420-reducing hydrogenase beta subunit